MTDILKEAWNVAADYPGGAAALGKDIGVNPVTFSHAVKGTAGSKLGAIELAKMTVRSGDIRALTALSAYCGYMPTPLPETVDQSTDECMLALSQASKEFADVVKVTCESMGADGEINDNELAAIIREVGQLIAAGQALATSARARNHKLHQQRLQQ